MVLEWLMPTFANDFNSLVHDNVSTVSAIIIDVDGTGVRHAYL
jgi:hypothetical protein